METRILSQIEERKAPCLTHRVTAANPGRPILLRYWGSHFKSPRQVEFFRQQFAVLIQRGWQCHFVLERPPETQSWLHCLTEIGVQTTYITRPRCQFDWECVRRIYNLCREIRADVIQCDNTYTSPLIGAFLASVPVRLWTKRNMNNHFEQCRPPTWREKIALSTRISCLLATRVIAVSGRVRDELIQMGIPARRILVRPNFRSALPRGPLNRSSNRRLWGFAGSDVVLVTIGHAVPVKGWDLLLRAFRQVTRTSHRVRLLFIGSTAAPHERSHFSTLERFVHQNGLADVVRFAGHLHEVSPALSAADVFVLSSRSEAFCYALIEALEMGLPCVATRVGIAEEVIQDGTNGFLVERNDWRSLAEKIEPLVLNDDLRRRFAKKARVPDSIPSLSEYAQEFGELYAALLPGSAVRLAPVQA